MQETILARLTLKKGKERPILQKHHWIYSGAISTKTPVGDDGIVEVYSSVGEKLGLALLNGKHSIAAHMVAFGEESLEDALRSRIQTALSLRKTWFRPQETNAFRLLNAEGDGIPGLIVDSYANVLVVQISHPGLEIFKDLLIKLLVEEVEPRSIYEKSTSYLRKKGGMEEQRSHLYGEVLSEIDVLEYGMTFRVDFIDGQKTGFFLDQREMRHFVRHLSLGKKVLNCFSYTGGFSIAALIGGASFVDSVEISNKCGAKTEQNLLLNRINPERHRFVEADVFHFLKTASWDYDLIILDPPAFVKKREDVSTAFRAYKEMNQYVMKHMKKGSLLLTCSCSYHVEEALFQNILFRAADTAKRNVKIVSKHRMAIDHPISIFHPESAYLKGFLLAVD